MLPAGAPGTSSVPATLPPHVLANITRRQLVDALHQLGDADHIEAQVRELVLEYIGRRWSLEHGDIVDAIAKKLADIEIEVG